MTGNEFVFDLRSDWFPGAPEAMPGRAMVWSGEAPDVSPLDAPLVFPAGSHECTDRYGPIALCGPRYCLRRDMR